MHLSSSRLRIIAAAGAAAATVAAVAVVVGGSTIAAAGSRHDRDNVQPRLDRAFVIMLENHSQQGVVGDPNAPFITALAHTYGQATQYYGVTHPSEPNYVAAISGSNWWVNNDDPANRFDHTNIVDSLEASRISWGAYMEAMPADDKLVDSWPGQQGGSTVALYASKHNPFVLFPSIRDDAARMQHVKPYTALAADLNRGDAPRYVFISPDQCNDMHGGVYVSVAGHPETPCPYGSANDDANDAALKQKADAFVQQAVTTIMHSKAWTAHSAIFVVADEGDFTSNAVNGGWDSPAGCCDSPVLPAGAPAVSAAWPGGVYGGGLVPAIVVTGRGPRHVVSDVAYNHYSLLRTLEDAWGLPELGYTSDHAQVSTMNALLGG